MPSWITSPRDFWTGLVYITIGGGALWLALGYRLGTAGKMGPGYFPQVLSVLLIGIGVIALLRSVMIKSQPVSHVAWKPLLLITAAIAAFGTLVQSAGLVVALLALILLGAAASREFRFDAKAFVGMVLLISLCGLVFVKGLGLPLKLVGPWLAPAFESVLRTLGVAP